MTTPIAGVLGAESDLTLHMLADLCRELEHYDPPPPLADLVHALRERPGFQQLPGALRRAHGDMRAALGAIRQTRTSLESFSLDRLRDTHAKLNEVSSTTESATIELLNGLDRSLALIDTLEREGATRADAGFDALRTEVNNLYGHLQFQDIIAQQLHGVAAMLGEVEGHLVNVARLFDENGDPQPQNAPLLPEPAAYNAEASMHDVEARQAMIDAAFRAARTTA